MVGLDRVGVEFRNRPIYPVDYLTRASFEKRFLSHFNILSSKNTRQAKTLKLRSSNFQMRSRRFFNRPRSPASNSFFLVESKDSGHGANPER